MSLTDWHDPLTHGPASHFVTVDYVATLLHADRRTVCNWLVAGRLRGTRPGGVRWLIARDDLNAFLQAASNAPAPSGEFPSTETPSPPAALDLTPPPAAPGPAGPAVNPLANRKNKRRN